jgi:hypothetical protein
VEENPENKQLEILQVRYLNGVKTISLSPTLKMRLFAISYYCDPEMKGMDPEEVLTRIGLPKSLITKWQKEFDPYFTEWMDDQRAIFTSGKAAKMLEAVGMERALSGDFQFWKPMSIKHKVIEQDGATLTVIPANLGAFNEWTPEQLNNHRDSLLSGLRGLENQGRADLAPSPPGGKPEGDPRRTIEVPARSVVLDEGVGSDGERPLED